MSIDEPTVSEAFNAFRKLEETADNQGLKKLTDADSYSPPFRAALKPIYEALQNYFGHSDVAELKQNTLKNPNADQRNPLSHNLIQSLTAYQETQGNAELRAAMVPWVENEHLASNEGKSLTAQNVVFGNGSFELINAVATNIKKHSEEEKPVIIMPSPTWGIAQFQMQNLGFEVIPLPLQAENGWKETPEQVQQLIDALHAQNKQVSAYYNANPHMPTGAVKTDEEVKAFAEVFKQHPGITIIDDGIYKGSETGEEIAVPFAKYLGVEQAPLISGLSKVWGGPSLRGAFMVGSEEMADDVRGTMGSAASMGTSYLTQVTIASCFAMDKATVSEREQYQDHFFKEGLQSYHYKEQFFRAMVNGIDTVNPSEEYRTQIINDILVTGKSEAQAEELLKGVEGITAIASPKAGFMTLVQFDAKDKYHGEQQLKHDIDLMQVIAEEGKLVTIPGMLQGGDKNDTFFVRMPYARNAADTIDTIERLHTIAKSITNEPVIEVPTSDIANAGHVKKGLTTGHGLETKGRV